MSVGSVRQLRSRSVYRNAWMTVREDDVERPDGSIGRYGVVDKTDYSLAVRAQDSGFHLVEQYTYPLPGRFWGFPQGSRPDLETGAGDALALAHAELGEDTGFRAGSLSYLGRVPVAYGYSSQACHVVLVEELTAGDPAPEASEVDLLQRWVSRAELGGLIRNGLVRDAATLAALALFDCRLTEKGTVMAVDSDVRLARRPVILALLAASHFILILDSAIVGVALPSIGRDLGFAPQDLSWVPNGYILLYGGFLILGGRLGDLIGRRRLFAGGLALFSAASLVGALAPSPGWLIGARALQGFAAALVSPTALSLVLSVFPNRTREETAQRNKALGTMGAVAVTGGSVGLFAGGVLTDLFGWEAVFYVVVPIGLLGAALAVRLLPADAPRGASCGFDVVGALTVTGGMTLLVFTLVNTNEAGWCSARIVGSGFLAVALLVTFVVTQHKGSAPLVPLRIVSGGLLRAANRVAGLTNMVIGPTYILLSLYNQQVLGFSALGAGLAVVPLTATTMVSSKLAGRLLERFSVRTCTVGGLVVFAAGILWLAQISGGTYVAEILGPLMLVGLGSGVVFVAFTVAGTAELDERDAGLASAVLSTSQQIGAALGLASLTAVATWSSGDSPTAARLTAGYGDALLVAVVFMVLALASAVGLRPRTGRAAASTSG